MTAQPGPTPYGWHAGEASYRCLKEYQLQHVRKVTLPQIQTPDSYGVGLMVHAGRARWFSLNFKVDWNSIKEAMQDEAEAQPLPVSIEAQNKALEIVRQYIDWYCTRPAPEVVGAEYLIGPVEIDGELHTVRVDDASKYPEAGGGLWIGECKTTWEAISKVVKYYSNNAGQILKQALVWSVSEAQQKHGPISGILLDVIQKPGRNGECKFARHAITVSDFQLEWFRKSEKAHREMQRAIDWNTDTVRNPEACVGIRVVAGDIWIECPYLRLCKHGPDAASEYMIDGQFLNQWTPSEGKTVAPWQ